MMDPRAPGPSILLVDDDPLLCDLIARILTDQGFQVTTAHNLADARLLLREASLAIIDVMLPDGSGLELLSLARSLGLELDALVLTGRHSPEIAVEALRLGAVDYLQKPVDAPSILRAVRSAWEKRRARADLARISARLAEDHHLTALGRMAAGAAHEINNPIAAVLSNLAAAEGELAVLDRFLAERSELARNGAATELERARQAVNELRGIVSDCVVGSRRIVDIVRGMRQLAPPKPRPTSESQEIHLPMVPVSVVLQETERLVSQRPDASSARWRNTVPSEVLVAVTATDLAECLADLVANGLRAIQHVDDGTVTFTASIENGQLVFVVEDDGTGIGQEDLPHVFDPFFTLQLGDAPGLGMAVVRERIRRMGGTVDVSTLPGLGTEARVTLPLVSTPQESRPSTDDFLTGDA